MINNITLRAFKSFAQQTNIPFKRLNIISGINSSGKSSIIQSIRILNALIGGKPLQDAIPEGLGTRRDLTNNKFREDELAISMSLSNGRRYSFPVELNDIKNDTPVNILYISSDRIGGRTSLSIDHSCKLDCRGENSLKFLYILQDDLIPKDVRHENAEKANLLPNLIAWLKEITPGVSFKFDIQDKADTSYALYNDFRATNVGYGLSYTLPVILSLLWGSLNTESVVIIENPEAHLHPQGQSKIAELICKVAASGCQIIIETHSDHILNGVRVQTKKHETNSNNGISRDLVNLIHVSQDCETKDSSIYQIPIEENGRIYDAPDDFFNQFNIDRRFLMGF